ncbi:MAG: 50S ribosomal protein L11 methyltransferase [Hydrogenothermaceae bacterium]|nr:50S ribosomal protein L11 methyltransferase [Hydrogenothermaceae bacterium]
MKKFICQIPENLFEIFVVELNGYGFEILGRENQEVNFAIYGQDEEFEDIKQVIEAIFEDIGNGKIQRIEDIKEEDWEEKWKENFKPIQVGKFIIIPEWEIYEEKDFIPIKIKVSMAFGTGLHPTTRLLLKFIPDYITSEDTVLDVGTGTGILAIASKKVGAKSVDAFDIDPRAVEECKINAWENEVDINCFASDINDNLPKHDILLSNLQMDIFKDRFDILAKKFKKYWLVSGIFKEEEKEKILKMAEKNNLQLVKIDSMSEEGRDDYIWYGFVFKHN